MWVSAMGAFSLAAVLNQIANALCRHAQAATKPDLHEQWFHRDTVSTHP
ncbi:MAG: hypothetical protein QOJ37_2063 [Pseudonocardiales bacterium]|nr:hypothetical protein [Pseudonocardiales bacterium]